MKNADKPAMPFEQVLGRVGGKISNYDNHLGLTKREHFAAMAMQGLCAHSGDYHEPKHLASDAVAIADALLEELEQSRCRTKTF